MSEMERNPNIDAVRIWIQREQGRDSYVLNVVGYETEKRRSLVMNSESEWVEFVENAALPIHTMRLCGHAGRLVFRALTDGKQTFYDAVEWFK